LRALELPLLVGLHCFGHDLTDSCLSRRLLLQVDAVYDPTDRRLERVTVFTSLHALGLGLFCIASAFAPRRGFVHIFNNHDVAVAAATNAVDRFRVAEFLTLLFVFVLVVVLVVALLPLSFVDALLTVVVALLFLLPLAVVVALLPLAFVVALLPHQDGAHSTGPERTNALKLFINL
jgi:hypothetical protein